MKPDKDGNISLGFGYTPRKWQIEAQSKIKRFFVMILHRRAGKTCMNVFNSIMAAMNCPNKNPVCFYLAATREQVKEIAWGYYKEYLKDLRNIQWNGKPFIIFNESDLSINFAHNNAFIYLKSYENGDSLKGRYVDHAVLDEYQLSYTGFFDEIILPMLLDKGRKGKVIFSGTIKGRNQLWQMMQKAKSDPDWGFYQATCYETDAIDPEEIELMRKNSLEEKFKQEMLLDPDAQVEGAFFGAALAKIVSEKRLIDSSCDPTFPVVAGLDVGLDGTGITYVQNIKGKETIIDFDFYKDKDASYIAKVLSQKSFIYSYILLPHDGKDKNAADKTRTYEGVLKDAGFRAKAIKRTNFLASIHCSRDFLNNCLILKSAADKLLDIKNTKVSAWGALGLYCAKEGSETELHDEYSHLGSSLRTLATGLKENMTANNSNPFTTNRAKKFSLKKSWRPYR